MNENIVRQISARIRNIFMSAKMVKRNGDDSLQIETSYNRVIDGVMEAFPYGFKAKAVSGKVTVLCSGGSLDAVRILPVESVEGSPKLQEEDVAIYSASGSNVICRQDGSVEIAAKDKVAIKNDSVSIADLVLSLVDEIEGLETFGSPPQHKVSPASKSKLDAWKQKWQELFK